jgi:hypothetical protein
VRGQALVDEFGYRVVAFSDADAVVDAEAIAREAGAHAVRLPHDAVDEAWLRAHEFFVKPTWIVWVADATAGAAGLLAVQTRREREDTRAAMRKAAPKSIRMLSPVDPDAYEEWLRLYSAQVRKMRNGVEIARNQREQVLDPSSGHALVTWHEEGRLVGGCVIKRLDDQSILQGRFSAVHPALERIDLPRAMYACLADLAREAGLRTLTLGFDPNLYGALVKPGLCSLKLRLGFRPLPANRVELEMSTDVAERVCRLEGLVQPVVLFAYGAARAVGEEEPLELVAVTEPGFESPILRSLPSPRLVVAPSEDARSMAVTA